MTSIAPTGLPNRPWTYWDELPETFNFAADVVSARALKQPGGTAIVAIRSSGALERWTFGQVDIAARNLAATLASSGLVQGDRVLVMLPAIPAWHIAMSACMYLGIVPVPCVTQITGSEVAYRARRSGARGAITHVEHIPKFEGIAGELQVKLAAGSSPGWIDLDEAVTTAKPTPKAASVPIEAPALMYFTSGTSGEPKAVLHAARGVYVRSIQPWRQFAAGPSDLIWATSDTGWTRAASCMLFGAWMHGAAAFLYEGRTTPEMRLRAVGEHGITIFCAVATDLRLLLQCAAEKPDLSRLRMTLAAGEVVTAELIERWRVFTRAPVVVGYGQTETPTATMTDPKVTPVNGMIGQPLAGNHVCIIDAEGEEAASGIEGDIAFASDDAGLMLGFWSNGSVQPGPMRRGKDRAWYVTGDRGYRDAEGNLFFLGRDDDIISSGGYRIGPTEVENALLQHRAVRQCAVVATPDDLRGEAVKAFIVLNPGFAGSDALVAELQAHVKETIAPYKYPRQVAFVDSLPLSGTGKVMRRTLREAEFRPRGKMNT